MFDYIVKGGWVMIPILACSVFALAIVIERFYSLTPDKIHPEDFVNKIKKLITKDKISQAIAACNSNNTPIAKIVEAGIMKRNKYREQIKEAIEHAGRQEAGKLQRYLTVLATVANITPLLGLLGTVIGMIKVFQVISVQGVGKPAALATGISEALITTAAGLIIAIPTVVFYNYFYKMTNNYILEMENSSIELLDLLSESEGEEGE